MRGVLAPEAVHERTIEDRFMQRLADWPRDRHIDETLVREWIGSISSQVTQILLLSMLDKGILRMNGFRYFRA
jgi:hypothetical protein